MEFFINVKTFFEMLRGLKERRKVSRKWWNPRSLPCLEEKQNLLAAYRLDSLYSLLSDPGRQEPPESFSPLGSSPPAPTAASSPPREAANYSHPLARKPGNVSFDFKANAALTGNTWRMKVHLSLVIQIASGKSATVKKQRS